MYINLLGSLTRARAPETKTCQEKRDPAPAISLDGIPLREAVIPLVPLHLMFFESTRGQFSQRGAETAKGNQRRVGAGASLCLSR